MTDKKYNTSNLEGMTGIPKSTLGDYVRDFRDFFSEDAKKPVKGRKYNDADLENFMIIRRARDKRMPDDEIRKMLSGEIPSTIAKNYQEETIKDLAANAADNIDEAKKIIEGYEMLVTQQQRTMGTIHNENQSLKFEISELKKTVEKLRFWQIHMMKLDSLYNPWHNTEELTKLDKDMMPDELKPQPFKPGKPNILTKIFEEIGCVFPVVFVLISCGIGFLIVWFTGS